MTEKLLPTVQCMRSLVLAPIHRGHGTHVAVTKVFLGYLNKVIEYSLKSQHERSIARCVTNQIVVCTVLWVVGSVGEFRALANAFI